MAVLNNSKRYKPNRKASFKKLNKTLAIGAIASFATLGSIDAMKKASIQRAQKREAEITQSIAYRKGIEKRWVERLNQLEMEQNKRVELIKSAIKKGMLPRFYTRKDGSQVIVDYIDPPSRKGVIRSKPIETLQADLIRNEMSAKKSGAKNKGK